MKFYNISDPKKFFENIANKCNGVVEIISNDGLHLQIYDGISPSNLIPFTYLNGKIKEIELNFQRHDDCMKMFSDIISFKY